MQFPESNVPCEEGGPSATSNENDNTQVYIRLKKFLKSYIRFLKDYIKFLKTLYKVLKSYIR